MFVAPRVLRAARRSSQRRSQTQHRLVVCVYTASLSSGYRLNARQIDVTSTRLFAARAHRARTRTCVTVLAATPFNVHDERLIFTRDNEMTGELFSFTKMCAHVRAPRTGASKSRLCVVTRSKVQTATRSGFPTRDDHAFLPFTRSTFRRRRFKHLLRFDIAEEARTIAR